MSYTIRERCYYKNSISEFTSEAVDKVLGGMLRLSEYEVNPDTRNSWKVEITTLQEMFRMYSNWDGGIAFEFTIPRIGKRCDVIAIINGVVFILEYKTGQQKKVSRKQQLAQVWDYALDLKNFHSTSHNRILVPILVNESHDMPEEQQIHKAVDDVVAPLEANTEGLGRLIEKVLKLYSGNYIGIKEWSNGVYNPTPNIIEAACSLYKYHNVNDIKRSDADDLIVTTKRVMDIIEETKRSHSKAICFVTGVPGAGKTRVGLDVAIEEFNKGEHAVYLSGNGPLVNVLTEALANDKAASDKITKKDAEREVHSFIQAIHHYRGNMLSKITVENGKIRIKEDAVENHEKNGYAEVENVAIFDEAQRAWTRKELSSFLNNADFPMSEPSFLIWSMDQKPDWAVIVCLVGGGQEINHGEAGISEWINAINNDFPHWKVYISDQLKEKEYAEGNVEMMLKENRNVQIYDELHLKASIRSFRGEELSPFVHYLLEMDIERSKELLAKLTNYPIVMTRSLSKAKQWLRDNARGSERYGLLASSQAKRIVPMGLALQDQKGKMEIQWFLKGVDDIRSSYFLENVMSEFKVQGLELDWAGFIWDADFRYNPNGWECYNFKGTNWTNSSEKDYKINAYRVLLTRARQGMIIIIPPSDPDDFSRKEEYYQPTYKFLKSLGIKEI
ncbi:Uncharacterized conserved protein [Prevotella sp. khp1]|uniref:DUF2075 domain-containing protein n=1 Tax=Prevotellaceae TaxID=171552 RepID=UPI00088F6E21|nr:MULTISPECIES: DUF2075 domain-containing protein [Prevotellaceae]QVJ81396.1 DUF2075 domain-containing protein [Xylanibacter ruminicola]SDQ04026.1 Uncharacterized conserved protein [Prevotella sp. khp1]